MPRHNTSLNLAQQQLLDLTTCEENIAFFATLLDDVSPWPEYNEIRYLLHNLGNFMMGNSHEKFDDKIQGLSRLISPHENQIGKVNSVLLAKFITCIEELIQAKQQKPFPALSHDQTLAIRLICNNLFYNDHFIYHCRSYQSIHRDNKAIQLLQAMKAMARGENNRREIYFIMASMLYSVENSSVPNPNKNKQRVLKNYLFDELSKFLFQPSFFDKIMGAIFAVFILSPIFIMAHNPIYHFLHLFRSRDSKKLHLEKIITYPLFILTVPFVASISSYQLGIQVYIHHFAYVTGRQSKGLTVASLLIIAAAIAASLAVIFFPPVLPLVSTTLPILAQLSPILIAIAVGLTAALVSTTFSAIATMLIYRQLPPKLIDNPTLASTKTPTTKLTSVAALPDVDRSAALGSVHDYANVIAPQANVAVTLPQHQLKQVSQQPLSCM